MQVGKKQKPLKMYLRSQLVAYEPHCIAENTTKMSPKCIA